MPGKYSGAEDLGPEEQISLPTEVDIHGATGEPRPVIWIAAKNGRVTLNGWSQLSDLEIVAPEAWSPLTVLQSTAERVVVRAWAKEAIACNLGFRSVLRDSFCISNGEKGAGAGQKVGTNPFPSNTRTLRNVTAIGAGPESVGILFDISGGDVYSFVKSSIAQGTRVDVEAVGREAEGVSAIFLEESDFATRSVVSKSGGVAFVTEPGTDGNITAEPLLAADGYHQLPGSPTIDEGIIDESSGSSDIDGGARVVGEAVDIGADEMLTSTTTTVSCLPATLTFGNEITCNALVDSGGTSVPSGSVVLTIGSLGSSSGVGDCDLSPSGPTQSACELRFVARNIGQDLALTAAYPGDPSHASSQAVFPLTISPLRTAISFVCTPTAVRVGFSTECKARVVNVDISPAPPTGLVHFQATGAGSFWPASACLLAPVSAAEAACEVAYAPSVVESGIHRVSASYAADEGHLGSAAAAIDLDVFPADAAPPKPNTILNRRPARRTKRHRAYFTFTSTDPGARFQCKVDRARYRSCRSPFKVKMATGRHVFRVRAVRQGRTDPTPATFRWTVLRR